MYNDQDIVQCTRNGTLKYITQEGGDIESNSTSSCIEFQSYRPYCTAHLYTLHKLSTVKQTPEDTVICLGRSRQTAEFRVHLVEVIPFILVTRELL